VKGLLLGVLVKSYGQEAFAQRAERDKTDPEFFKRRKQFFLPAAATSLSIRFALPQAARRYGRGGLSARLLRKAPNV
jgi:hypothetical protein